MENVINGVDIVRLAETINLLSCAPNLGGFKFQANSEWVNGGHVRVKIQRFYTSGGEDTTREEPFVIETDEPAALLGGNKSPNPVEFVLAALVSCLSVGFSYNAAARGIRLKSLQFDVDGDLNLCGFMGLSDTIRPGYNKIDLKCRVEADATPEQLEELGRHVQKTSPVLDIVSNPTPVSFTFVKTEG